MKRIVGLGNALVDILIRVENDNLLKELNLGKGSMQLVGEDFRDLVLSKTKNLKKSQASGGSAANTIHGLASLGADTAYIGKIGDDELGDFFFNDLKKDHIHPCLTRSNTATGVATTLITPDSERTFGTFLGAAVELGASDLENSMFKDYQVLHLEGYLVVNAPLIEKALTLAKANGMTVSLDLASYNVVEANLDFLKKLTNEYVDIIFANEEEAKAFTGKTPEAALDEIAAMCHTAVVKVGKNGSLIKHKNATHKVEATEARVIDTTGAGDLYAAGFLYGFAKGLSPEKCGRSGALLAGKVIEEIGATIPADNWVQIRKMIQQIEVS